MGEEPEGPVAAPRTQDGPYPEQGAAARRRAAWRRAVHPGGRRVLTSAGVFGSAAAAADFFRITRQAASHRARLGLAGWRYLAPNEPEPTALPIGAKRSAQARAVETPLGLFPSAAKAAIAHGISRQRAAELARRGARGWRYVPSLGIREVGAAHRPSESRRSEMT